MIQDIIIIVIIIIGLCNFTHSFVSQAVERSYIYNGKSFAELQSSDNDRSKELLRNGREIIIKKHMELAVMFKNKNDNSKDEDSRPLREQEYHERKANMRPSVIVIIRARPPNSMENKNNETVVVNMNNKQVSLIHPKRGCSESFRFYYFIIIIIIYSNLLL